MLRTLLDLGKRKWLEPPMYLIATVRNDSVEFGKFDSVLHLLTSYRGLRIEWDMDDKIQR